MKIAIIAWGSLTWDPRDLPFNELSWDPHGPSLRVEFSRVSQDGRLTLVIAPHSEIESTTLYVTSTRTDLEDAVADLRAREGTTWKNIGYVCTDGTKSAHDYELENRILTWTKGIRYDAAVWTALKSNYPEQFNIKFDIEHAANYLATLPPVVRKRALEYINKAPPQIRTPLRLHLQNDVKSGVL